MNSSMNKNTGTPVVAGEGSEGVQTPSCESGPQQQIAAPLRHRVPPRLAGVEPKRQKGGGFHPFYPGLIKGAPD